MQKSEMELSIVIYDIIIEGMCKAGFCRKGLKKDAYVLLSKMKEDGPISDSGTYNTLIRTHLRDGDKLTSVELIKEMRSCRFCGDASTICLVTNMLHDGRLDKSFLKMLS
ncbi:hypothetical protein EUTSA_v10015983mg [Eutrema salsugineum]|uniref:Pentacotripeptide-repeat region of PRORP domain-containing protein n=1 Tax=Eutrema salsugineum TaxID=72664 RepID=V4LU33_EUTSA|nr:hypothetical protein EUTSA_v10015983mg [Eutrema salsugineum]